MRHSKLFVSLMKQIINRKGGVEYYRTLPAPEPEALPERYKPYGVDLPYPVYSPAFETLMFGNISMDREDYDEKVWHVKNHLIASVPGANYWLSITRDDISTIHLVVTFPLEECDVVEIRKMFANIMNILKIVKIAPELCEDTIKHFNLYMTFCEIDEVRAEEETALAAPILNKG